MTGRLGRILRHIADARVADVHYGDIVALQRAITTASIPSPRPQPVHRDVRARAQPMAGADNVA
jgi:hypothetical protein